MGNADIASPLTILSDLLNAILPDHFQSVVYIDPHLLVNGGEASSVGFHRPMRFDGLTCGSDKARTGCLKITGYSPLIAAKLRISSWNALIWRCGGSDDVGLNCSLVPGDEVNLACGPVRCAFCCSNLNGYIAA